MFLALKTAPAINSQRGFNVATLSQTLGRLFSTGLGVFAITGVLLAFNRLSDQSIDVSYGIVLGLKVGVTLGMFWLAMPRRRSAGKPDRPFRILTSRMGWVVALGLLAYLLSLVMNEMAEAAFQNVR